MARDMTEAQAQWARCRPWLETALDRDPTGVFGIEDVEAAVADGRAIFVAGKRSAAVVELWTGARGKALYAWVVGGDLAELRDVILPKCEAWARGEGCTMALGVGRPGWPKALQGAGYETLAVMVGRAL